MIFMLSPRAHLYDNMRHAYAACDREFLITKIVMQHLYLATYITLCKAFGSSDSLLTTVFTVHCMELSRHSLKLVHNYNLPFSRFILNIKVNSSTAK